MTKYALHAGVTPKAASEQLKRVGIDYMQEFDFAEADRRRLAMRHADRAQFSRPIYLEPGESLDDPDESDDGDARATNPTFANSQAQKEFFRAELARLDFEERVARLVDKSKVEEVAFHVGRLVRDSMLNIPSRLAGILAAESDQRKVHDLLEREIRQALEALSNDDIGGMEHG